LLHLGQIKCFQHRPGLADCRWQDYSSLSHGVTTYNQIFNVMFV
jgi:hypothetical protein